MLCLKVTHNENDIRTVGGEQAESLHVSINTSTGVTDKANLFVVAEFVETPEYRFAKQWFNETPLLGLGDKVTIEVIKSETPDPGQVIREHGRKTSDKKIELYCNWCGKEKDEVEKLIVGPKKYICNECIQVCNEILRDESIAD